MTESTPEQTTEDAPVEELPEQTTEGPEVIPSPDVPEGADTQLELADKLDTSRSCACITKGEWTPTDQCALRPATRCDRGAPVWVAFQTGGPDAAAEQIAGRAR